MWRNLGSFRENPLISSKSNSFNKVGEKQLNRDYHNLNTLRRIKEKSKVGGLKEQDDQFYEVERLGNNREWSIELSKLDIQPIRESFRNLHSRRLVHYSKGSLDKNRALHVNVPKQPLAFHVKSKDNALIVPIYKKLFANLKTHLQFNNIFARDASVGAHSWAQLPIRIISDSSALDLSLSHLVSRVPLRSPSEQPISLTVYIASKLNREVDGSKSFAIFDPELQNLLIVGEASTNAVRDAIGKAVASIHAKKFGDEGLYLNADVLTLKNKNVVVFNDNSLLKQKISSDIFSAHGAFWTHNGLVKAWSGASRTTQSLNDTPSFGSVVENQKGESFVTLPLKTPNATEHPSAVVFLISDSKNALPTLSKLSPSQAAQFFLAGYNGTKFQPFFGESLYHGVDPNGVVKRFKDLVENMGVNAFILNTAGPKGLSSEETQKILESIADGTANVSGQKTSGNSSFESEMNTFIQTTFPTVQL
eukprot:TRINITY_DN728_c0_g1_i1.p1 TRINITY_DN728_c0_g1~~TRINITY_DN728_c0_g1_i1.p1  ORF type:complete len:477 (+),score=100.37 TRINITY_DN728_c0_g1_i1:204-1634(+)